MKILVFVLSVVFFSASFAAEKMVVTGEVFDKEGKNKKFTYEKYQNIEGDKVTSRAVYKDLEGKVLVEEKMETLKGELVRYDIDQKQLKKKGWIEATDKEITFNLKKFRKRNYPETIKRPKNFILGLQIVPFIKNHWAELNKGNEQTIKLGVWYRQEAITFDLTKDKAAKGQFVVKMSPSSMFIRAVVSPIYFVFDVKTKGLIEYKGRTKPKDKRGRDYYDYDGITRYKLVK